jgi:hypothetical protein
MKVVDIGGTAKKRGRKIFGNTGLEFFNNLALISHSSQVGELNESFIFYNFRLLLLFDNPM